MNIKMMKIVLATLFAGAAILSANAFVKVEGRDLVDASGNKFFIRGVNLGNWLNPEGYMFNFGRCGSAHMIDEALRELVGPEVTDKFWKRFKDNYIREKDIEWIAKTGSNTIRLPFHYKLFTDEDFLGLKKNQDGFKRLDDVIKWSKKYGLRVILDMHCCPGGQTGDNIDDSYGYPWLFESEFEQKRFCDIWRSIAERYADEKTVLAYDIMNEPISSRLKDMDELNKVYEKVMFMGVDAIRSVDKNHIVMLAGAQWNSNFEPYKNYKYDSNMMWTCHHYDFGNPKLEDWKIKRHADFSEKTGLPMYMGECGHNDPVWYADMVKSMEKYNIGWNFWPYKMPQKGGWVGFKYSDGWKAVADFAKADRSSYEKIQASRPDRKAAVKALMEYAESCKFENCQVDANYIKALGLKVPEL